MLFVVYGPLPPVKDQTVGHYSGALRLNQEQSMEFVLVIDRHFRKVMNLVCFPNHLQICPSNLLSAQPQFCKSKTVIKVGIGILRGGTETRGKHFEENDGDGW